MHPVVLSLGSNNMFSYEGEDLSPHKILIMAVNKLNDFMQVIAVSSLYITKPMYYEDQENFHNIAVYGLYNGTAQELLHCTQSIETTLGRDRAKEIRNGPRTLDIDILLVSDLLIESETLSIPHPKMHERAFVLVPMLEILPKNADTINRDYYARCLNQLDSTDVVNKIPFIVEERDGARA